MTENKIEMIYRNTEYGGYDRAWVINETGEILKPHKIIRSRSKRHGVDIYVVPDRVWALRKSCSNSGKCVIILEEIRAGKVTKMWRLRDDYGGPEDLLPEDLPPKVALKIALLLGRINNR